MKNLLRLFIILSVVGPTAFGQPSVDSSKKKQSSKASSKGGSGSNGGGGLTRKSGNWFSLFPGLDPNKALGISFEEEFKSFRKAHSEIPYAVCAEVGIAQSGLYIPVPPELIDLFDFRLRLKGKNNYTLLLANHICESKRLNQTYNQFLMSLYKMKDQHGFQALMKAIRSFDRSEITIILEPKRKKISGITEYTWFNENPDAIHYALNPPCKGFNACFGGRSPERLIRHELGHILMKRALRDAYPAVSKSHDKITKDTQYLFDRTWLKNKTSNESAFIESIANLMEVDGFSLEHPYVHTNKGNFVAIYPDQNIGGDSNKACYFGSRTMFRNSNGMYEAPLDNEIYTSSSLHAWIESEKVDLKEFQVYTTYNHARFDQILSAITKYSPKNMKELAESLVQIDSTGVANSWYLEFFFEDLSRKQNLREITVIYDDTHWLIDKDSVCLKSSSDYGRFFSSYRDAECKTAHDLADFKRSESLSDSTVRQRISNSIAEMEKFSIQIDHSQSVYNENQYSRMQSQLQKIDLCSEKKSKKQKVLQENLAITVYNATYTYSNGKINTGYGPVEIAFEHACSGQRSKDRSPDIDLVNVRDQLIQLRDQVTVPGTQEHLSRLKTFETLKWNSERKMNESLELYYWNRGLSDFLNGTLKIEN